MSDGFRDLVIIGAGQGGLSVSYFLCKAGIDHLVLDRGGVAHAWAAYRWDSFSLVTPNWMINLPGQPYDGDDPDGFMLRDDFVRYMKCWAEGFGAPVVGGVDVTQVARDGELFVLATSSGTLQTPRLVIATSTYQHPKIPPVASQLPSHIRQLHAEEYKNCGQAADGSVLVVGSGQTGCQIVEDFLRAGRKIYLCVAQTGRLLRRYRGYDSMIWLRATGNLDRTPDMLDDPARRFVGDPHLTGRDGGSTVSLHDFRRRGVTLLGRLAAIVGSVVSFRDDLERNLKFADDFAVRFMREVDEHLVATGQSAPPPTQAEMAGGPDPVGGEINSPMTLHLDEAGIRTVIWATGFAFDFSWIDGIETDDFGYPVTECGKSSLPGLYFCGLNWMTKRKSGIIYGVEEDARAVSSDIINQMAMTAL